ncbi:hypothetical protein TWF173_001773 [Orbilia oligospora]|nr:hypothetical protein TWF173_001773 [Orbilia oligospora]
MDVIAHSMPHKFDLNGNRLTALIPTVSKPEKPKQRSISRTTAPALTSQHLHSFQSTRNHPRCRYQTRLCRRQVLQEIETQAILSQQQLTVVKSQITSKQRDTRMIQLTESELSSLPASTKVYEGVGKMFIQENTSKVKKRLETERNTLEEDIKGLKKRQTYLETTYSNASDHMNKILNRSG